MYAECLAADLSGLAGAPDVAARFAHFAGQPALSRRPLIILSVPLAKTDGPARPAPVSRRARETLPSDDLLSAAPKYPRQAEPPTSCRTDHLAGGSPADPQVARFGFLPTVRHARGRRRGQIWSPRGRARCDCRPWRRANPCKCRATGIGRLPCAPTEKDAPPFCQAIHCTMNLVRDADAPTPPSPPTPPIPPACRPSTLSAVPKGPPTRTPVVNRDTGAHLAATPRPPEARCVVAF